MKVKLSEIIEGMELQSEDFYYFLNLETGKNASVSREALFLADEGETYDHLLDWQQEEAELAYQIIENNDQFIQPPSRYEINEYQMMETFCYNQSNTKIQSELLNSIRGRGAFRHFKAMIIRLGIEDDWFDYRDKKYKQIAIDFCEQNQIDYIE